VCGCCGTICKSWYDHRLKQVRDLDCGPYAIVLRFEQRRVDCPVCKGVRTERLTFLADINRYTERYAEWIGRQCREKSVKAVSEDTGLDWDTVKELDKAYMHRQLELHPAEAPRVLGIDELAVGPGHSYRILVHDLEKRRPLWMGDDRGRNKEGIDAFFQTLTVADREKIDLVVMDMWKPYRVSTEEHCPNARIHYDHFHIAKHLGTAIDEIRRSEYARLDGVKRSYIKGSRYILLSNKENLDVKGAAALEELLRLNKRLNKAYLLKEDFERIWAYRTENGARKFFDNWKASLKWQRLGPLEKFAALVERHWTGIVCGSEITEGIPMGYVEGMNCKIRAIQKRAYGIRDEEYLRLKILTCTLPKI